MTDSITIETALAARIAAAIDHVGGPLTVAELAVEADRLAETVGEAQPFEPFDAFGWLDAANCSILEEATRAAAGSFPEGQTAEQFQLDYELTPADVEWAVGAVPTEHAVELLEWIRTTSHVLGDAMEEGLARRIEDAKTKTEVEDWSVTVRFDDAHGNTMEMEDVHDVEDIEDAVDEVIAALDDGDANDLYLEPGQEMAIHITVTGQTTGRRGTYSITRTGTEE